MSQTRLGSFFESLVNTGVGLTTSVVAQMMIFPLLNIHVTLSQNVQVAIAFTLVSVLRNYLVRRVF